MERSEEIVILDGGSEEQSVFDPEAFCCFSAYGLWRS
jgi:hypothetical protein